MNFSTMFSTIDAHVAGKAFRIVIQSSITLNKENIKENQDYLRVAHQDECDFLLNEPRGHQGMQGCIVMPSDIANFGILFFAHNRQKVFSYSGLIATITALLETGNLAMTDDDCYTIETIHGIYKVQAICKNGQVDSVLLESSGSQVVERQSAYQVVEVDESRHYVVAALPDEIPSIQYDYLSPIMKWGKGAAEKYTRIRPALSGIILKESEDPDSGTVRSVTFEPDGTIVRSPGIDSTVAILTTLLETGRGYTKLTNKSIFDSTLTAHLVDDVSNRFSVQTQGFTTGMHQFIYDKDDPLKNGFLLT